MLGKILSVNISPGGIPKRPITAGYATRTGLKGDLCAHPNIHGGPDQALLLVCQEAIDEMIALGYPLFPGALGENLTTQGLDRHQMRPGQRYRAGSALIEITHLREPCDTLNIYGQGIVQALYDEQVKAGDPSSPKWGLGGFYAAVARPGYVSPGSAILLLDHIV